MIASRLLLWSAAAATIAVGLAVPARAELFGCFVGEATDGPVTLRRRGDERSRAIRQLDKYDMVINVSGVRERDGWIYVIWSKTEMSLPNFKRSERGGRGWIRRDQIRGECTD